MPRTPVPEPLDEPAGGGGSKASAWLRSHKALAIGVGGAAIALYLWYQGKNGSGPLASLAGGASGSSDSGTTYAQGEPLADLNSYSDDNTGSGTSSTSGASSSDTLSSLFTAEKGFVMKGSGYDIPGQPDEYSTTGQLFTAISSPAELKAGEKQGKNAFYQAKPGIFEAAPKGGKGLKKGTQLFFR